MKVDIFFGTAEEAAVSFRGVYGVQLCTGLWVLRNLASNLVLQVISRDYLSVQPFPWATVSPFQRLGTTPATSQRCYEN